MIALFLLWMACQPDVLPLLTPSPVDIKVRVAEKKVANDVPIELTIQVWNKDGWKVTLGGLVAEGLEVTEVGREGPTREGQRDGVTAKYELRGAPGSYVLDVAPSHAEGPEGQTREIDPPPVFVDIGVAGPSGGEMAAYETAPPPDPPPWGVILGVAAGVLALLGAIGALVWWRRHQPEQIIPPEPPHRIAEREWRAARTSERDDHALALELSMVLRRYLAAIYGWPATARTSREILEYLDALVRAGGVVLMDADNRKRARRILDATDRLKFAREGGGEAFFAGLDQDFLFILRATRPLGGKA